MNGILIPWVLAATILLFVGAYWVYMLEQRLKAVETRYQKMLALADDADHATIVQLLKRLEAREAQVEQMEAVVNRMTAVLPHTVQGYGMVRYNAYEGVAGDQSFSVALVDAAGNGILLSALYSRADTRVYAKPLRAWQSTYSLSAEDRQAIAEARDVAAGKALPEPQAPAPV